MYSVYQQYKCKCPLEITEVNQNIWASSQGHGKDIKNGD